MSVMYARAEAGLEINGRVVGGPAVDDKEPKARRIAAIDARAFADFAYVLSHLDANDNGRCRYSG